jgi:hypothetical protein
MQVRKLLAIAITSACVASAALVLAANPPRVTIGEITARAAGADAPNTETMLRAMVAREIEELRLERCKKNESFVLSLSLVKFNATTSRSGAHVSSTVSGTLRSATTGALLASMRGSGTVEDNTPVIDKAKARSLQTAVHGALAHVPDVI